MEKVNIIGAGLAGLSAAISLAENNIASRLISVQVLPGQVPRLKSDLARCG